MAVGHVPEGFRRHIAALIHHGNAVHPTGSAVVTDDGVGVPKQTIDLPTLWEQVVQSELLAKSVWLFLCGPNHAETARPSSLRIATNLTIPPRRLMGEQVLCPLLGSFPRRTGVARWGGRVTSTVVVGSREASTLHGRAVSHDVPSRGPSTTQRWVSPR